MQKIFLVFGALWGALGVMIGAFGAHALKNILETNQKTLVFDTAVKYHFWHALIIIILGMFFEKFESNLLAYSGWAFIFGTIVFSGSLYILSITNITKLGAITPIGGLGMIIGWILLAIVFINYQKI